MNCDCVVTGCFTDLKTQQLVKFSNLSEVTQEGQQSNKGPQTVFLGPLEVCGALPSYSILSADRMCLWSIQEHWSHSPGHVPWQGHGAVSRASQALGPPEACPWPPAMLPAEAWGQQVPHLPAQVGTTQFWKGPQSVGYVRAQAAQG